MLALLRDGAEMYPVDLGDLERDIRQGLVSTTAELLHPPWTGARFTYLTEIPQLANAFEAPDARFNAWLRAPRPPRLSVGVAALVLLAAALQAAGSAPGAGAWLAALASAMPRFGALGFEPTLLDGMWWTPLSSQLVHDPALPLYHALLNLPLVAYGGYRVERALGPGGYAVVAALALLCGALFVVGLGSAPAVGSSILGYGLWAAQIAIGFRFGRAIPRENRGFYGWGTWVVFAPLYALSLLGAHVTHTGHLGGVIGGLLAVAVLDPESAAPSTRVARQRRRNLSLGGALLVLPMLLALLVPRWSGLLAFPTADVELPELGLRLRLPGRLADHPVTALGGQAWLPVADADEPVFASLHLGQAEDRAAFWTDHLGGRAIPAASPGVAPGWRGEGWMILDEQSQEPLWRVVEQVRTRGRYTWRVGYALRLGGPPDLGARERLYRQAFSAVELGDPPAVRSARERWTTNADVPRLALDYALGLEDLGEHDQADELIARIPVAMAALRLRAVNELAARGACDRARALAARIEVDDELRAEMLGGCAGSMP